MIKGRNLYQKKYARYLLNGWSNLTAHIYALSEAIDEACLNHVQSKQLRDETWNNGYEPAESIKNER